jgi:hypothetical protein
MKGCLAAALVLLGWYWLIPAPDGNKAGVWTLVGTFDSALACRQAAFAREREVQNDRAGSILRAAMYQGWVCIASDDPRLAK